MDINRLIRLLKGRQSALRLIVSGLLIFLAGWQTGRVMSPYYAAHPITFTEAPSRASEATTSDLVALRDAGAGPSDSPQPAVAAASTQAPAQTTIGQFVGSVNSNKYHHLDCSTWKQIKPENQIWFDTRAEAEAAGYIPTTCTKEKLNI